MQKIIAQKNILEQFKHGTKDKVQHGIGQLKWRDNMSNDKTCIHAFAGLSTHPNGSVSLCCQAEMKDALGFAKTNGEMLFLGKHTIDEIRNSESFRKVRQEMLEGQEPAACRRCYAEEVISGTSKRLRDNKELQWGGEENLRFIELRLGNTCNLACITCNSVSSSKWLKDEQVLAQKIEWFKPFENSKQTKWFESEEFYSNLADISKHVSKIYINGGEPMLIKQHKTLLRKLIDLGVAKNVKLEYSVNLTIEDNEFIELWKEFNCVVLQVSIDAVGELNDYLRYGSNFENIKNTLEWLIENKPDNALILGCQTVSAMNALTVREMEEFFESYGLQMHVNPVHSPDYFSAAAMTKEEREKVRESFQTLKNNKHATVLDAWLDSKQSDPEMIAKRYEVLSVLDERRFGKRVSIPQ